MMNFEARLLRKQARLSQKLERVKAKLAHRALAAQSRRDRAPRDPYVSAIRGIVTTMAFGAFWWLGCDRINGFVDDLFGEQKSQPPRHTAASASTPQTFWTFGRRRRIGQSQIRP